MPRGPPRPGPGGPAVIPGGLSGGRQRPGSWAGGGRGASRVFGQAWRPLRTKSPTGASHSLSLDVGPLPSARRSAHHPGASGRAGGRARGGGGRR